MSEYIKDGDNVCLVVPQENGTYLAGGEPFCFQFVYETLPMKLTYPQCWPYAGLYLTTEGCCDLCTDRTQHITRGDLFCIRPGCTFTLRNLQKCKYIYLSFHTPEPDAFFASYGITQDTTVFPGFSEYIGLWMTTLGRCTEENLSTLTKGLLYYTLALLPVDDPCDTNEDDMIAQICSLIDRCYGDSSLSLQYVCNIYNYHPNYISRQFSRKMGCSFTEYLRDCRVRHAAELLTNTTLPIQEIACGVGYTNALYFSRIFHGMMGLSPSEYRKINGQKLWNTDRQGSYPQNIEA